MHGIYQLKEMLCEELEEYGKKGEINASTLDLVDKLAHTVKNLDKIIENDEDGGYSQRGRSYRYDGRVYDGSYDDGTYDGGSYRRGRGRNARRDSMGRYMSDGRSMRRGGYSRNDGREEMIGELEGLMQDAPNDMTRQRIEQLIGELRND